MSTLTLGSLFDGIGGFPLAAVHNGIIPVWASEIEAFPMEVTRHRFPDMIHVGDITKLHGAELPPVDIICGGSPCQDLSVAGKRAGLSGARSGLFMEQIRIVKEMRNAEKQRHPADLHVRPRFLLWENVPGAFSSGTPKGEGELISPWRGDALTLNTGVSPREEKESSLSQILQVNPPSKYYLTRKACLGILRRAFERGKGLPPPLKRALEIQSGVIPPDRSGTELKAYHINQRDEGIDLHGVSGALMATSNMQMQTFVTQPSQKNTEGLDEYQNTFTNNVSTDQNGLLRPIAFAANQRDEIRDLHDVAGALGAQPGMKQQTFIAGFSAGAGASAGGIGYGEELAPTLKGSAGGNCMPSVLCLNDQGGNVLGCSTDVTGTLRAQEHGHQPLVYENHGIDSRYTGPHAVAPTMSARYGTGGNNVPLVEQEPVFCITGNAIDRQPQNGGNGIGYQEDIAYTLTATDHHAVFSRQRVDVFKDGAVVSTQSARQHKDATDLVLDDDTHRLRLIRRLTPLECERLQGFPDGWTAIPGASDSARYKALGNSVAIPCVDYVLYGISLVLLAS